jgi:preprotein translocase subunit SecG
MFRKIINKIRQLSFISILGILAILPFLIISIYVHPTTDDYIYHYIGKEFGLWDAQIYWYNNWSSRFTASFIMSIESIISGSYLIYKLISVLLILSLCFVSYHLSSILFPKLTTKAIIELTSFFIIIFLFQLPSVNDGFYWMPGSMNYMLGNVLTFLFMSFIVKLIYKKNNKHLIISTLLLFLIYGTNEISMIILNVILIIILFYRYYIVKRINRSVSILVMVSLLLTIFVLMSPGNAIRASKISNNHMFFDSVWESILLTKTYVGIWLAFILLMSIYFFASFKKDRVHEWRLFNVNPLLILGSVFFVTAISFFPAYWSNGAIGPPKRLINATYFFFLSGFIYFILSLCCYFKNNSSEFISYSKWVKYSLLLLIILKIVHHNNIRFAYTDLISGKAYYFDKALIERYQIIKSSERDTIIVPHLNKLPRTIYHDDIDNDFTNWKNTAYSTYFNKIIIIE